jgi:hypothetical protein
VTRDRWAAVLLCSGAIVGAALAAAGLLEAGPPEEDGLDESVVATVDGRPILREHYDRALAAVQADRRGGELAGDDRGRVLERLVDEELLIGRALELGLASRDRRVRNDLANAMIDVVRARAVSEPADEDALRAFYAAHAERFRRPPRYRIEHAFFRVRHAQPSDGARDGSEETPGGDALARAEATARGDARLPEALGDAFGLPVSAELVPLSAIARLFGPTAARGVTELEIGEVGGPWRGSGGYHVVRLVEREDGELPPFESIAEVVREEHTRVAAEEELRALLARLRAEADVVIAESPR